MWRADVPLKPVVESKHPLEKYVKHIHASKLKNTHNSVHNPPYNPKEEAKKIKNLETGLKKNVKNPRHCIKFTIIGNMQTKDFIHCARMAEGLRRYKPKHFACPEIRALNPVEWIRVWNNLKVEFGGLMFCLQSEVAVLVNGKCLGGKKEMNAYVGEKYKYYLALDYYSLCLAELAKFIRGSNRPFVYMHIAIDDNHIGTLIFMLYADIVPFTCDNFLRLVRTKRGGYSGTPIHRIVKDGWIQGGGYGLKEIDFACENFVVPHDQRGVLGMANHGRNIECSTQFYVLLQPMTWMDKKFVAFGQLVDGVKTLDTIEQVQTWYEAPKAKIIIEEAGILNIECHHIPINKNTMEYLSGHVEDINALTEWIENIIMERIFLEIRLRELERLARETEGEDPEGTDETQTQKGLHSTKRFLRNKEEIDKQNNKDEQSKKEDVRPPPPKDPRSQDKEDEVNNDFDVEEYRNEWQEEEESYQHMSLPATPSLVVKPMIPYYLAFTDVPYPDEKDSTHDLKKFLKGDYCLGSDLYATVPTEKRSRFTCAMPPQDDVGEEQSEAESAASMDSEDEKEIRRYLKTYSDVVSFAGGVIRKMARNMAKINIFQSITGSDMLSEELRTRLASFQQVQDQHSADAKKVSIALPEEDKEIHKIRRRPTGFVKPMEFDKIQYGKDPSTSLINSETSSTAAIRKVRIAGPSNAEMSRAVIRRQTGYLPPLEYPDADMPRPSVLTRLYADVKRSTDEHGPTLKDYVPVSEYHDKKTLLTYSSNTKINEDGPKEKYFTRGSMMTSVSAESYDEMLNMQHGHKFARKISTDYVSMVDQVHQKPEVSIRTIEYAKKRPALTVKQYQKKNTTVPETQN